MLNQHKPSPEGPRRWVGPYFCEVCIDFFAQPSGCPNCSGDLVDFRIDETREKLKQSDLRRARRVIMMFFSIVGGSAYFGVWPLLEVLLEGVTAIQDEALGQGLRVVLKFLTGGGLLFAGWRWRNLIASGPKFSLILAPHHVAQFLEYFDQPTCLQGELALCIQLKNRLDMPAGVCLGRDVPEGLLHSNGL